jgi:REP element-mobilizing transposase RayT
MARPLRINFENAVYHIIARGNRKEKIFYSEVIQGMVFCLTRTYKTLSKNFLNNNVIIICKIDTIFCIAKWGCEYK